MKITQLNIKTTKILLFVINKAFNKEIAAQLTPCTYHVTDPSHLYTIFQYMLLVK